MKTTKPVQEGLFVELPLSGALWPATFCHSSRLCVLAQEIAQEQGVQAQPTVQAWKQGKCIEVRYWPDLYCSFSSAASPPF